MGRTKRETGFTLITATNIEKSYYATADALKAALKANPNDGLEQLLFIGPSIDFEVSTETIVTIGEPKPPRAKKGQMPVSAGELLRKNKDGSERKKPGRKAKPAEAPPVEAHGNGANPPVERENKFHDAQG